ncbi:coenzyme A pyrophosphatase, partial [Sulfolobus sp. F3]
MDVKKLLTLNLVDDKDCDASVVVLIAKGEYVLV